MRLVTKSLRCFYLIMSVRGFFVWCQIHIFLTATAVLVITFHVFRNTFEIHWITVPNHSKTISIMHFMNKYNINKFIQIILGIGRIFQKSWMIFHFSWNHWYEKNGKWDHSSNILSEPMMVAVIRPNLFWDFFFQFVTFKYQIIKQTFFNYRTNTKLKLALTYLH